MEKFILRPHIKQIWLAYSDTGSFVFSGMSW